MKSFSAGHTRAAKPSPRPSIRVPIDPLEQRRLLTSIATPYLLDVIRRDMTLTGTAGADRYDIEFVPRDPARTTMNIRGNLYISANGGARTLLASDQNISNFTINTGGGDDQVTFRVVGRNRRAFQDLLSNPSRMRMNLFVRTGDGNDSVRVSDYPSSLFGGDGNDSLAASDRRDDLIDGGAGDDNLDSGLGADSLLGGDGIDAVDYSSRTSGVYVDLFDRNQTVPALRGPNRNGYSVNDGRLLDAENGRPVDTDKDLVAYNTPTSDGLFGSGQFENDVVGNDIENALGGSGNDVLLGDQDYNLLSGNGGNDTLVGGLGNDLLIGGDGDDLILASDRRGSPEGVVNIAYPVDSDPTVINLSSNSLTTITSDLVAFIGSDRIRAGAGRDIVRADHFFDNVSRAESVERIGPTVTTARGVVTLRELPPTGVIVRRRVIPIDSNASPVNPLD
jgi:Ca2+-binding RTX toxin-like protein